MVQLQEQSQPQTASRKLVVRRGVPYVLATIAVIWTTSFARIDYDRIHDGAMLSPAIAVHSGLHVHADVMSGYGPVTPWLQSLFLYLPLSPALALRAGTVLTIGLIVFLLADFGRIRPTRSPIGYSTGLMASISWLVVSDIWLTGPMRPWSSLVAQLGIVLTAYLAHRGWRCVEVHRHRCAEVLLGGSGYVFGLAVFARVGMGFFFVLAAAMCSICVFWVSRRGRTLWLMAVIGFTLAVITVVLALLVTSSLGPFVRDAVTWPLNYFSADSSAFTGFFASVVAVYLIPVSVGIASLFAIRRMNLASRRGSYSVFAALCAGLCILGTTVVVARLALASTTVVTYWTSWRALMLLFAAAAVAALGTFLYSGWRLASGRRRGARLVAWYCLAVFAGASLMEIVPDYNGRHAWWSLPLGLLLIFSLIPWATRTGRILANPLVVPMLAFGAYAIFASFNNLSAHRVAAPEDSIAAGMLVQEDVRAALLEDRDLLARTMVDGKGVFMTVTGDLAVLQGSYASIDPFFTCWGPLPDLSVRLQALPTIVVDPTESACPSLGGLADWGYLYIDGNDRLDVYQHP